MAKQSGYLLKQQALHRELFNAGYNCGRQQIIDGLSMVLRDPAVVGKDIFGRERLIKVIEAIDAV